VSRKSNITKFFTGNTASTAIGSSATSTASTPGTSTASTPGTSTATSTIAGFGVLKGNVTKAEVIYVLSCVKANISFRASESLNKLFPSIFPDSEIAKQFSLGRTKFAYLLCFGLAPFFKEELIEDLKSSGFFCAMFDEALNKVSQKSQMDIIVRYVKILIKIKYV
jgi:hypothetical protein